MWKSLLQTQNALQRCCSKLQECFQKYYIQQNVKIHYNQIMAICQWLSGIIKKIPWFITLKSFIVCQNMALGVGWGGALSVGQLIWRCCHFQPLPQNLKHKSSWHFIHKHFIHRNFSQGIQTWYHVDSQLHQQTKPNYNTFQTQPLNSEYQERLLGGNNVHAQKATINFTEPSPLLCHGVSYT